jgi:hypothetical protein
MYPETEAQKLNRHLVAIGNTLTETNLHLKAIADALRRIWLK